MKQVTLVKLDAIDQISADLAGATAADRATTVAARDAAIAAKTDVLSRLADIESISLHCHIAGVSNGIDICWGYDYNSIAAGGHANTISGGGYGTMVNVIIGGSSYQTIGGGYDNQIDTAIASTIGGGAHHRVGKEAGASSVPSHGTIAGGSYGTIKTVGGVACDYATIGGGTAHIIATSQSTIGGGAANTILGTGQLGTIAGGSANAILNCMYAAIGGGSGHSVTGSGSTIPGGINNQVSGGYSWCAGKDNAVSGHYSGGWGLGNTLSGWYSACAGRSNTASGAYSVALGHYALARSCGITQAGGMISALGDSQHTESVAKKVTTDATSVVMTGSDDSQYLIVLPADNYAVAIRGEVVAVDVATGDSKSWTIDALYTRRGGSNTSVGAGSTVRYASAGASAWIVGLNHSTNNVRLFVQGDAGKTVRWTARLSAIEVSY